MNKSEFPDPFEQARLKKGIAEIDDQDDPVKMVLRLRDLRKTAHNYQNFTSAAIPGRIVVPSEVNIRETRQIPFELDPPLHTDYRAAVEPWFKRPLESAYQAKLKSIIEALIDQLMAQDRVEVVSEFALPLQSRALTLLLNIPYEEAELWISWGTHVFRSEGEALDGAKAEILYDYIDAQIDKAIANPGADFYSVLLATKINGRKMTPEEVKGVLVLTFAGGRDTVINTITNSIAYFAEHPESMRRLQQEPEIIKTAIEELMRYFAPLTHMGRVVTAGIEICEHAIEADSRVSLCWASANRDAAVFDKPNEIVLDRKMNPHVSFGFSHHNCLGATHARQIMKILFELLPQKISSIKIHSAKENIESIGEFKRKVGFEQLEVSFQAKT
ncbi:MAG: cytochrome P450 [Bacteroidota bacterium]